MQSKPFLTRIIVSSLIINSLPYNKMLAFGQTLSLRVGELLRGFFEASIETYRLHHCRVGFGGKLSQCFLLAYTDVTYPTRQAYPVLSPLQQLVHQPTSVSYVNVYKTILFMLYKAKY